MAYDEGLADRVRGVFEGKPGVREQKMFGCLAFMLDGNMACGVHGGELIVRVGRDNFEDAMSRPYTRPFDLTGRLIRGFVLVYADGVAGCDGLSDWVKWGIAYAESLPPK